MSGTATSLVESAACSLKLKRVRRRLKAFGEARFRADRDMRVLRATRVSRA